MNKYALMTLLLLLAPLSPPAQAQSTGSDEALKSRLVQHMALNPSLVKAVRRQNAADTAAAAIEEQARQWRQAEDADPIKWQLQESAAGRLLRELIDTGEMLTGAYLTDRRGVTVAAYPPPREFVHASDPAWRTALQAGTAQHRRQGPGTEQIAVPVIDRGEPIGVLFVSLGAGAPAAP